MWAGHCNVLVGDRVVGVGWVDETIASAIRDICAEWPTADVDQHVPVAFGVRSVAVGLRRRRMWLVHHGTPVRHRADDLAAATRFVRGVLQQLDTGLADGEVSIACRAFLRDGRAVLVHVPDDVDLDERPLRKRGIEQLAALSTVVRPAGPVVVQGDATFELVGAVIDERLVGEAASLDDARRHLMSLGYGERTGWAWAIDHLGPQIAVTTDPASAIRRLLRSS